MIKIVQATFEDCPLLTKLSKQTFLESHGNSASKEDIDTFISNTYNEKALIKEFKSSNNVFFIIYYNNEIAGYSKIVLDSPNTNITKQKVTKLDRFYLLKEFYGQNLGIELFNLNIEISKNNKQQGIWLAVWVKNLKAIQFYKKMGFEIVGSFNFKISKTHSNPNHILYLPY